MKRKITLLILIFGIFSLCGCQKEPEVSGTAAVQPEAVLSITDGLGNTVSFQQPPQRVAALVGSYAECWILAGGEQSLKAVTQDALDERGLSLSEDTAVVGTSHEVDLEGLFAAKPDLVILTPDLDGQTGLADALSAAGIPNVWFKVESFSDYLTMLREFTALTGREDLYEKHALAVQKQIDAVLSGVPAGEKTDILLLRAYSSGVKIKNSDSIAGRILLELGCTNIADSNEGLLEDLQMEIVLQEDPEHIFVTTMGSDTQKALESLQSLFDSDPAWQSLSAVREGRVHVLDKKLFHYKPNARWGESYEVLSEILYPKE